MLEVFRAAGGGGRPLIDSDRIIVVPPLTPDRFRTIVDPYDDPCDDPYDDPCDDPYDEPYD